MREVLSLPNRQNLSDTIVVAPLSPYVFPGAVAELLAQLGVAGALLYPEPSLGCNPSREPRSTYPNGRFLPDDAVVVGSLRSGDGDPLSPGLPSIDGTLQVTHLVCVSLPSPEEFINLLSKCIA